MLRLGLEWSFRAFVDVLREALKRLEMVMTMKDEDRRSKMRPGGVDSLPAASDKRDLVWQFCTAGGWLVRLKAISRVLQ